MEKVKLIPINNGYKVTGGGESSTWYATYKEANSEAIFRMKKMGKITSGW